MTVVDASVAVRWFVETPESEAAGALLDGEDPLVAPDLVVAEVLNTSWKLVRAGEIAPEHGARIAEAVSSCFTELVPSSELAVQAFSIARDLDHPVYDCLYLALAARREETVVTTDRRLLSKLGRTAHEHLAIPLTPSPR